MPSLQKKIFLQQIDSVKAKTFRDVYNAYMTSYFGAWLNNFNFSVRHKKYIVGFIPRFAMRRENMNGFFEIYPDGKLISIVRDPKNWYPSASRHKPDVYPDVKTAISQWLQSVQATIWNKEKFGERVCIIRFEDLIAKTEMVMQHLSGFLGIEFNDIMLKPTFNRSPIRANTSFELEKEKIVASTLYRYETLGPGDLEMIQTMTAKEYERVIDKSVQFNT